MSILSKISKFSGGVDTFYFVQGLNAHLVATIERSLIQMQACLRKEIFMSSVTKGNKIDQEDLEERMDCLKPIADKCYIKGRVIDYRCPYKRTVKQSDQFQTSLNHEEQSLTIQDLHKCLMGLEFFSFKPLLENLQKHIDQLQIEIKENSKQIKNYFMKNVRKQRNWYTLWRVEEDIVYYEPECETVFTKTDSQIQKKLQREASQKILKK